MNTLLKEFDLHSIKDWENEAELALDGKPISRLNSSTYESISINALYTKEDLSGALSSGTSLPGTAPYLRGVSASGYKQNKWRIAQDVKDPSPEEFNEISKKLLNSGVNSLNMFVNTSLLGANPDIDYTENGEISLQEELLTEDMDSATYLNTADDFSKCLEDLDLKSNQINIYCDFFALHVLPVFKEGLKKLNIEELPKASVSFDPISSLLQNGELSGSKEDVFFELLSIYHYCKKNFPEMKLRIDGASYRDCGANAIQELAFSFASAIEYLKNLVLNGIPIDEAADKFIFDFSAGPNFFMEIAKFRAARVLWFNIISAFEGSDSAGKLRFSARMTNLNKSKLDRQVNILRNTTESLSAVIGGADSITTLPFDESLKPADDFSRRIAKNTQLILQDECNLTDVIDPAGGSYLIESLTNQITEKVWAMIQEIESKGGMLNSVINSYPQSLVNKSADTLKSDLASRKESLLGTNKQARVDDEINIKYDGLCIDIAEQSVKQVISILDKIEHDDEIPALRKLADMSSEKDLSLIEILDETVSSGASVIDILDAVRTSESLIVAEKLTKFRSAEDFELLRINAEKYKDAFGSYPSVFIAAFGSLKQYKGRVDFTKEFFSVGGFSSNIIKSFADADEALTSFKESGSKVCILCSSDDMYEIMASDFARKFKEYEKEGMLILAGFPPDKTEEYKQSGVDDFIHIKANILSIMDKVQNFMGMKNTSMEVEND